MLVHMIDRALLLRTKANATWETARHYVNEQGKFRTVHNYPAYQADMIIKSRYHENDERIVGLCQTI